ncbi:hypothetical protein [Gluconobacter wancherniae]|uniref:hypothetical protein n=1 Tax=Gluconobacter wancherniae TaxID=1307955 RepID=UPI001B8AD58E|nr:hypothetical protein [Gluconobacter wancherniae]MBS1094074.1 hypothetical protein [Gluconobacter wancherniae]
MRARYVALGAVVMLLSGCVRSENHTVMVDHGFHETIRQIVVYGSPDQSHMRWIRGGYDQAMRQDFAQCGISLTLMRHEDGDEIDRLQQTIEIVRPDVLLMMAPVNAPRDNTMFDVHGEYKLTLFSVKEHRFVWRGRQKLSAVYEPGADLGARFARTLFNRLAGDGLLGAGCHPFP